MAKSVGLDIGSQNIRLVELSGKKDKWVVDTYGSAKSPEEKGRLVKLIKELFKEAKVSGKSVNISLPETQSFTQIIKVPLVSDRELDSAMKWQAEQYIPLPLDQVSFDFEVIERNKERKNMRVVVSAAPLTVIKKYTDLVEASGLEVASVETQILSIIRAVSRLVPGKTVAALVNLGYKSSDFAFVTREDVLFTNSLPTGGYVLTRAISQELGFSEEQAERYKLTYGVDQKQLEGKVYAVVSPLLDRFLKEINKGFVYFKENYPEQNIGFIFVCGGGALMPGIVRYMTDYFGIETQRAEPFANTTFKKGSKPLSRSSTEYTVATGLAMRNG